MKNFTCLKTLLIALVFISATARAQETDPATYFAWFITAQKHLKGDGLEKDTLKAFELLKDCAENGNMVMAMTQLGRMYKNGYGTEKDYSKAVEWFEKSVAKEDPIGMFLLGSAYKMGEGVFLSYEKAYELFSASAGKGFPGGMYGAGYCKFKGLGTEQSYSEAVEWFEKGVDKNNIPCHVMLGRCYKNGYGIEMDTIKANKHLSIAAKAGVKEAELELKMDYPEIDGQKMHKKEKEENTTDKKGKKEKFEKLVKHNSNVSLEGTWTGTRYLYDWSGEHILSEKDLYVELKQTGNNIICGQWFEDGKLVVNLKGSIIEGQIVFNDSRFLGWNRYQQSGMMEFRKARFESIDADVAYLAGNVESYSPDKKEPGYPCYVIMSKMEEKAAVIDTAKVVESVINENDTIVTNNSPEATVELIQVLKGKQGELADEALEYFREKDVSMKVYPNPFTNRLSVSFETQEDGNVSIQVFGSAGNLVLQKEIGFRNAGSYTEQLQFASPPGQYIIRLQCGNETYSKITIKQ